MTPPPFNNYYREEDDTWNWYYCSMLTEDAMHTLEYPWPVFAESFDAAMNIFMVLVKLKHYGVS